MYSRLLGHAIVNGVFCTWSGSIRSDTSGIFWGTDSKSASETKSVTRPSPWKLTFNTLPVDKQIDKSNYKN